MLAKIHLETACGCHKKFLLRIHYIPQLWAVPIHKNTFPVQNEDLVVSSTDVRYFRLKNNEFISKIRVKLWYEEVVQ